MAVQGTKQAVNAQIKQALLTSFDLSMALEMPCLLSDDHAEAGWRVVNVDATIIAERPKLGPLRPQMADRLTVVVGAPVSVKATTHEGLGAIGRGEGIACLAVALLEAD